MILKIIGTALTGIGGHYLNKRWDKANLFLSLFILYCVFCWVALRTYFFSNLATTSVSSDQMMQQFRSATSKVSIIYLSGIIILWVISIILTIADGKKTDQANIFKWTKIGVASASLSSFFSFFLLGYTSIASVSTLKSNAAKVENSSIKQTERQLSHNFYEYIYFGGSPSDSHKLPEPPEGQGVLKGQILYEDKPAEGVMLDIVLNSKYRAKNILTDSNGIFTLKLAVGDWKINSIQTESWQSMPNANNFTIYYGGEAKLIGNSFNRYNRFQSDGFSVTIDENKANRHLSLVIKKDVELIWPDGNAIGVDATISDTINWKPYPLASKYYVEIRRLRREGTTTYYNQITSKVLSHETSISLSSLKHIKTNGKENQEYDVEIYAFSENGTLIGEHSDTYRGGTFILTDGHMLVEDKLRDLFDSNSDEDPDKLQKKMELISLDRRRIDAVEILIDDNMISEAETLLKLVSSEFVKGRKEVLFGYIHALKGNCSESTEMFKRALSINPEVCIPDSYKSICEKDL